MPLFPDQEMDTVAHFIGGLVCECHAEDFPWKRGIRVEEIGDTVGDDAGFSGAGARKDKHRPFERSDRASLFGIKVGFEPF